MHPADSKKIFNFLLLLNTGIDCSLKNRDGKTVMEILTEQKNQSSYSEVISLITGTNNSDKDININETMCKTIHCWEKPCDTYEKSSSGI